jgi:tetratricopeptide (TPR) repeat protein
MTVFFKKDLVKNIFAVALAAGIIIFAVTLKIDAPKQDQPTTVPEQALAIGKSLNNEAIQDEKVNNAIEQNTKSNPINDAVNYGASNTVPTNNFQNGESLSFNETELKEAMDDIVNNRLESALINLDKALVTEDPKTETEVLLGKNKQLPDNMVKVTLSLLAEVRWQLGTEQEERGTITRDQLAQELLKAERDFSMAISFDRENQYLPSNEKLLNRRAQLYIMFGRYEDALKDFDKALNLDPEYLVTYFYRGRMKLKYTQDKESGCLDLKKAYNDPNDTDGSVSLEIVKLFQGFCSTYNLTEPSSE